MQHMKKHSKNPQDQTNEEIGRVPERECKVTIVKMIKNPENKMEIQINRLEAWMKKMQECLTRTYKN